MIFLRLLGPFGIAGAAISLILGILLGVQKMETRHWHKQSDQYEALAANYKAQLDAISTAKNQQKIVTKTKLQTVTRVIKVADDKAKVIEQSPDAPNCKTPKAILQSVDL
jgi:hypothetical protein